MSNGNAEDLVIDPSRTVEHVGDWRQVVTGILVRARDTDGTWANADIGDLDRDSLLRWLRSRGGSNPWAESVVLILLGHEVDPDGAHA